MWECSICNSQDHKSAVTGWLGERPHVDRIHSCMHAFLHPAHEGVGEHGHVDDVAHTLWLIGCIMSGPPAGDEQIRGTTWAA